MGHPRAATGNRYPADDLLVDKLQVDRYLVAQFRRSSATWLLIGTIGVPVLTITLWVTATDHARLALWLLLMLVALGIIALMTVIVQPRISFLGVGVPSALCGALWGLLPHLAMPSSAVGQGHLAMSFAFTLPACVIAMSTLRLPALLFSGALGTVWLAGWILHVPDPWRVVTPALIAMFAVALISIEMMWRSHRDSAIHAIRARLESEIDPLTGLLNRRTFATAAARSIDEHPKGLLFFIDLDDFSLVSDLFGYDVGDQLLVAAASRIRLAAPSGSLVGRVGGDEISILVPNATNDDVDPICAAIARAFENVFILNGQAIRVECTIGAAHAEQDQALSELLRRAHQAMLEAKRGGARHMMYSAALRDQLTSGVQLRAQLTRGLDDGEFAAYLQPIVDVSLDRVLGFEALARWETPERVIAAAEFHPAAAANGLLPAITRVVTTQVVECIAQLEPGAYDHLLFGVNVDVAELGPMLDWIAEQVVDPNRLIVEITEHDDNDNMPAPDVLAPKLESGIRIVLDDFGVAFSSLGRVLDLPIGGLKVDASFVKNLTTSSTARAVVEAVVTIGRSMDLTVVAEGVETQEQSAALIAMGIPVQQGYLHSRPLPIDQALALLD